MPHDGAVPFETVETDEWTVSTETCRSKCRANKRCAFFTHALGGKDVCQLFSDFSEVTLKNDSRGYVTSEREKGELAQLLPFASLSALGLKSFECASKYQDRWFI